MEASMSLNVPQIPETIPSAMGSRPISPKFDPSSRSQFLVTTENEYIQDFMGTTLKEFENEAHLQDTSDHPGMGLLLSLSDKLVPTMNVPCPSGSSAVSAPMPSQVSPSTEMPPPAKALEISSPVAPPSLTSPASSLFAPSCTSFDHNIHLDTIASAASEAAATQYKEPAAYQSKSHGGSVSPTSGPLPSSGMVSFAPSSSNAYLYMLRHTAFKDSKAPADGQLVGNPHSSPPSVAPSTPNVADGPSLNRVSTPVIMDGLAVSTPPIQGETPAVIGDSSLPRMLANTPLLDDELKQRQVIEDAVRKLNAHHHLAQSAALRHHEALGMTAPSHSTSEAPLLNAATAAQALADNSSGPSAKRKVGVDIKQTKRGKIGDTKLPETVETMQKRFQCPKCSRAFARAYNLNTHLSTHDPDPSRAKPFPCPYRSCRAEGGRSFSRKHDLQRHVASVHEWEPEPGVHGDTTEVGEGQETGGLASLGLGAPGKKFRCEHCGRGFVRRDALRRHHCERSMSNTVCKTVPTPIKTSALPGNPLSSHVSLPVQVRQGGKGDEPMAAEPRPIALDTGVGPAKQADAKPTSMECNHTASLATASV